MKVEISSSQREQIDEKYKDSVRKLCEYLANDGAELVWGSGSRSIMGICYEEFSKKDRPMYGITSSKYVDEIKDLPKAKHEVEDDTLLLKRKMMNMADMLLMVPGGTGTISEFFAYLEEIRSNDANKVLVIYDEYGHFDKTFELIDDLIERNFNDKSIYNYFKVAHNIDEFINIYNLVKEK